jgi:hypothetical protein
MLYYNAVDAPTLELLKSLMQIRELNETRLVGGTALALQIGHRLSVDIDLFGRIYEDLDLLFYDVKPEFVITKLQNTQNIKVWLINGIKVDFVNYPYNWLESATISDGIRLTGLKDIAAMKLSAITGRGTRKDFIDLYFLLNRFSLNEMMGFYRQKFPDGSEFLVLKSLNYFTDAEREQFPNMLKPIQWDLVKSTIRNRVEKYIAGE